MSKSGDLLGHQSVPPPEENVEASADMLADRGSDAANVSEGENSGIVTGEAGAGERNAGQTGSGEESDTSSEYVAGARDGLVGAARPGERPSSDDRAASDERPAYSVSASAPLRAAGEGTVSPEENSSKEPKSKRTSLSLQSIETGVTDSFSSDRSGPHGREDDPEYVKQREDARKILGVFASSSGPSPAAGQKKIPETLATHRWKMAYAYVKKINAMKKRALTSLIGTGATMEGYALGFLGVESETRKMLFDVLYDEKTEYFLLGLILSHLFVLILKAEHKWVTHFHPSKDSLNVADIVLTSFYTAECVGRIITLGLYRGPHAYLRNSFNKLDLIIVVDSWVHIVRTYIMNGDKWLRIAVLRMFRALLILRHFSFVGDVFAILDAIRTSVGALETVIVFTLIFLSFYALLGVQFFGGILHQRCERNRDRAPTYPESFCHYDWFLISAKKGALPVWTDTCARLAGGGNADISCKDRNNPNWGATHFDNFAASILIVFQVITFEGWSLISIWTRLSTRLRGVDAYFVTLVIFGGFFLVNVFVATISGVFLRVRKEHQLLLRRYRRDKAFSFANAIQMATLMKDVIISDDAKLNWRQRLRQKTARLSTNLSHALSRQSTRLKRTMSRAVDWNDPNSYLKRISSFGLTGIDDFADIPPDDPSLPRSFSRSISRNVSFAARFGRSISRSASMKTHEYVLRISAKCWMIVHSKVFKYGVLFFITFNMTALCTLKAKMTPRHSDTVPLTEIDKLEIALIVIFAAELIVRFVASGLPGFIDELLVIEVYCLVHFRKCDKIRGASIKAVDSIGSTYLDLSRFVLEDHGDLKTRDSLIEPAQTANRFTLRMNVIDLLVVLIACGNTGPNRKFINATPIRMLRWFYVKRSKRIKRGGEGTPILASVLRSVGGLASVYFFFFMVICIFSIFSMELWGGQMDNFDDGYPRANHDTFLQAMLLWFTVTTGESWVNYMWDAMRPGVKNRWFSPFLFVFYYMVTAFVILNLIIATILEETELTDNQKKHIQKREHVKWLQTRHQYHLASKRNPDWIIGAVEGAQKGLKDVRRRMTSMRVSRLSIFPSSQLEIPDVPQQQTVDTLPTASSSEGLNSSQEVSTKVASYSAVDIPGSTEDDDKSRARILRRSSASALSSGFPTTDLAPSRRRLSLETDKLLHRSGFTGAGLVPTADGGNRTVLQSALLAVADERAFVAAATASTKPTEDKSTATAGRTVYGRTSSGRRVSFVLSEFEGVQASVEVRAAPWWMNDRSLFLFRPDNTFRVYAKKWVEHRVYGVLEIIMIGWGVVLMILVNPAGDLLEAYIPHYLEMTTKLTYFHEAAWCLDLALKTCAYGFIFTPDPYLGDPFNWIDLLNLMFDLMYLRKTGKYGEDSINPWELWDRACRCLISFRCYRIVGRFAGLRSLLSTLTRTIPAISQIFVFTFVVYAIFAAIGIQLYADRFRYCSDPNAEGHLDCVGMFKNELGSLAVRTWKNPPFHFDAFGPSLLSLFVASTFDSWPDQFLYPAMDMAHKIGLQPRRNASPAYAIYCVSFIAIGGFFILRMFVGVFIDQFGVISGAKLLTERQKLWRDTNRLIQGLRPKRVPSRLTTSNPLRRFCFRVVHSRRFELLVVFVIMVNYLYRTTIHVDSDNGVPETLIDNNQENNAVECMFVSLFLLEAAMKLLGTQMIDWWDNKWNAGELVMVIISVCCLFPSPNQPARFYTGAFFITARIFRVIRYFPALNTMVSTVLISMPAMINVVSLMGVFLACLAKIGEQIFYRTRPGSCIMWGQRDFTSWEQAFIVLLQLTTLDNWSCILTDLSVSPPRCVHTKTLFSNDCGYPEGGIIYVLICVGITTYIFGNLFIAQILDTITFGLLSDNVLLTPGHVVAFQVQWSREQYDPKFRSKLVPLPAIILAGKACGAAGLPVSFFRKPGLTPHNIVLEAFICIFLPNRQKPSCTGYMGQHKLKEFLTELGPPLGGRRFQFVKWYSRIEFEVNHFRNGKGIAFRPLLETVCLYKIGPRGLELPVRIERERQIHSIYQKGAAVKIQGLIRGFLQRRRNKRGKETEDGNKRYSQNPDDPPDVAFAEDPLLARLGVARPPPADRSHDHRRPHSTAAAAFDAPPNGENSQSDGDQNLVQDRGLAASSAYATPLTSQTPTSSEEADLAPEIVPAEP